MVQNCSLQQEVNDAAGSGCDEVNGWVLGLKQCMVAVSY